MSELNDGWTAILATSIVLAISSLLLNRLNRYKGDDLKEINTKLESMVNILKEIKDAIQMNGLKNKEETDDARR